MKISDHIDKIFWSYLDKAVFVAYGFFVWIFFQVKYLDLDELGRFGLLISITTWIILTADVFALQSVIQFGSRKENRPRVNLTALILFSAVLLTVSGAVALGGTILTEISGKSYMSEIAAVVPIIAIVSIPRIYCLKFHFRDREFKNIFFINLANFGAMTIFTLMYLRASDFDLSFADMKNMYILGTLVSSVVAVALTFRRIELGRKGDVGLKEIAKFGTPIALYSGVHSLPKYLDSYAIKFFFTIESVGVYYSARTIYRVFEEAIIAANSMVYPVAVGRIESGDSKGLNDLITKAVSFLIVTFAAIVLVLELGGSEYFISTFLPARFEPAIGQFNLMILAALVLPATILPTLITAQGKPFIVLRQVTVAAILSIATFVVCGLAGAINFMPLGIIVYAFALSAQSYIYLRKPLDLRLSGFLRAFGDGYNFLKKFIDKRTSGS